MKNIVVITGSPRKGGNSDKMANAFIKGAASQGHKLAKIAAADMNIHGCHACDAIQQKSPVFSMMILIRLRGRSWKRM